MKRFYTFFLLLSCCLSLSAQQQTPKLLITPLHGDFYIFTTYNLYKGNPVPANGMYLVTKAGVVMMDSPWDTTQFQPLLDSINNRHHQKVVICIATHSHADKTAGLGYYTSQGIRTYTTIQTDSICRVKGEKRARYLLAKDTTFNVGGYTFTTFYPGQGHTPDNIVAWFARDKVLYGGCLVKSTEATNLGNLQDANPGAWAATIRRIQGKFGKPAYVIPGHDGWTSNQSLEHTVELVNEFNKNSKQK
ncbi:MAG: BlaB/IND/MUS family subclass B1 metallo-beta-lactamase [Chitinophagaceae bacterium]|nr:MAG: BlaB/IND/MUS family subclass B1 metallo-beta-lactamase [Chitinophagaceae bacterium]